MRVSLIVPVYDREKYIKGCLDSLLDQDFEDYEVIVVDDCSSDGTRNILQEYYQDRIKIIYNETNRGPSFCRNLAVKQAQGEIVAFTDSDCIADRAWVRHLVDAFRHDTAIAIVAGKVEDPPAARYWQRVNAQGDFVGREEGFVRKAIGCNMAVRKDFILRHSFDQSLEAAEDMDLCLRALQQQRKIYYTPLAKVLHHRRNSFLTTLQQQFNYGFWNTHVNIAYRRFPFLSYGAWFLLLFAGVVLFHVLYGNFTMVVLALAGYAAIALYVLVFQKNQQKKDLISIFPGFFLSCLANSTGSLCGFFSSVLRRCCLRKTYE